MSTPSTPPVPPPPTPTANVAGLRDYLLALLRESPCPVAPTRDLTLQLRSALGLLKFVELADIEARLVALEATAQELKRQPYGRARD